MADALGDFGAARAMLARARCVLFDFDGPICRLFPHGSSLDVADELRELVVDFGQGDLLTERARTDKDPHVVLRTMHRAGRDRDLKDLVERLEERVTAGELAATRRAWPTPGARAFIRHLAGRRLRLAVVTNNAADAAVQYLRARRLDGYFESFHGRTDDPDLMKPDPDVLCRALRSLILPEHDAVMIGDTPTDVEAAARAGVRFIGYGRNAEKRARLREAGAKTVLGSYVPLLHRGGRERHG
ncbi:HAD family hydrolase [Streptomyces sp. NPDC057474]|uniref:HAD family hydrolase n=1 Tax=Streptomyces sp. NPDC057474 TaxID=3346144 RepID=UPI0036C153D1